MRVGDWIQIVVMVVITALVFLGLMFNLQRSSRSVGGKMSKRVAASLVVRRALRLTDRARWN
jgi:archaellin